MYPEDTRVFFLYSVSGSPNITYYLLDSRDFSLLRFFSSRKRNEVGVEGGETPLGLIRIRSYIMLLTPSLMQYVRRNH